MLFFALFSVYILRGRFYQWFASIDRFLYRKKWFLKYSYRQFALVRAKP
jgi:hypothetical protein